MLVQNCAVSSIAPYQPDAANPWNERRVAHLYRRLGFGATYADIQAGLNLSPSALVDQLIDAAAALPSPTPPYWANWTMEDYEASGEESFFHYLELSNQWIRDMIEEGIRAKMALFWHGHFVTSLEVYNCTSFLWKYHVLLQDHAFGNFRTFVEEIGKTPAMLVYLNGNVNLVGEPNENYAPRTDGIVHDGRQQWIHARRHCGGGPGTYWVEGQWVSLHSGEFCSQ